MNLHPVARRFAIAGLSVVLIVGTTSCAKASDKISEKVAEKAVGKAVGGDVDVDSKNGGVHVKTKDGEYSSQATKKLPSDWPGEILPVPKGFTIQGVVKTKTPSGNSQIVSAEGRGDPATIADSYEKGFKAKGLDVAFSSTSDAGGMVSASKGSTNFSVVVGSDADKTTVTMTIVTATAGDG